MIVDFTGKTAIVTGAAGGVGYVCAKTLLESGAKVAAVDLKPEKAAAELSALGTVKGSCPMWTPSPLWWSRLGEIWARWTYWCSARG